MNSLEKRSFYSFLALYIFSSFLFILLSGYWYYTAQKNSLESETYYKLEHFADKLSGNIINAHMTSTKLQLPTESAFDYKLIQRSESQEYIAGYFEKDGTKILISDSPREHLNISYVLVKTDLYAQKLKALQELVLSMMSSASVFMVLIAFTLAKIFMKPLQQRVKQIESFIQDVTHELNTPITALSMSASRAIKKRFTIRKFLQISL